MDNFIYLFCKKNKRKQAQKIYFLLSYNLFPSLLNKCTLRANTDDGCIIWGG